MTAPALTNPPLSKIEDGLYPGEGGASHCAAIPYEHDITAIPSLPDGRWIHWHQPWYKDIIHEGDHLFIPCNDGMSQDVLPLLRKMCDFIDSYRQLQSGGSQETKKVIIHCDRGISQSPRALIAYLIRTKKITYDEALALCSKRRKIKPNKIFREQLQVWEAVKYEIWADEEKKVPKQEYKGYLMERAKRLKEAGLTGVASIGIQIYDSKKVIVVGVIGILLYLKCRVMQGHELLSSASISTLDSKTTKLIILRSQMLLSLKQCRRGRVSPNYQNQQSAILECRCIATCRSPYPITRQSINPTSLDSLYKICELQSLSATSNTLQ